MIEFALTGARIFTGEAFLDDHALVLRDGILVDVIPQNTLPGRLAREALDGGLLVPGFIDVQVNGGGGVFFNADITAKGAEAIARAHARFGTTAMLPTLITDRFEASHAAIAAVEAAKGLGVPAIVGLHLEGPHLSLARKGAHDPAWIRPMDERDRALLLGTSLRPLLLTVAAETVSVADIRNLSAAGILVSIGHSNADYATAKAAFDAGACAATHLFNAMSPMEGRSPGVVGATLDDDRVASWIIADGYHAHDASLRIALRAKRGTGKLFLVTDAMPTTGDSNDSFALHGRTVTRRGGRLTLPDGTLAGSDLTMDKALRYAVQRLDVPLAEALRMASLYPAQFLGLETERGRLAPGFRADLVHLDDALGVIRTWIGGNAV